jgi:hypothetical protein
MPSVAALHGGPATWSPGGNGVEVDVRLRRMGWGGNRDVSTNDGVLAKLGQDCRQRLIVSNA